MELVKRNCTSGFGKKIKRGTAQNAKIVADCFKNEESELLRRYKDKCVFIKEELRHNGMWLVVEYLESFCFKKNFG